MTPTIESKVFHAAGSFGSDDNGSSAGLGFDSEIEVLPALWGFECATELRVFLLRMER